MKIDFLPITSFDGGRNEHKKKLYSNKSTDDFLAVYMHPWLFCNPGAGEYHIFASSAHCNVYLHNTFRFSPGDTRHTVDKNAQN